MVTTTGLALFSLAVILLTRIYVSFNPPDFLRQYRDRDGNHCGTAGTNSSNSLFRRHYHLRPQVVSENIARKEHQEQDGHEEEEEEEEEEERRHDEHRDEHEDKYHKERSRPAPKPKENALHAIHVIPRSGGATTNPNSLFDSKQQDSKQAILHHLRNPSSSPSSSLSSLLPTIPTTAQQQQQPRRQWLNLELSSIHYNGSLEPFGTDDEVLKTIQDLQTGSHSSSSRRNSNIHNEGGGSGGGRNPSEFAKRSSLTVVWENGQWCCLEGRTLYVLRAVGWNGRIRARVLVDQGAGATL